MDREIKQVVNFICPGCRNPWEDKAAAEQCLKAHTKPVEIRDEYYSHRGDPYPHTVQIIFNDGQSITFINKRQIDPLAYIDDREKDEP